MRKSFFSKAIVTAGAVASAIVLSSIAVFADTTTYNGATKTVESGVTTWNFSSVDTTTSLSDGDSYLDIVMVSSSSSKVDSSNNFNAKENSVFAVPVDYTSGSITIKNSANQTNKRYATLIASNDKQSLLKDGSTYYYTSDYITKIGSKDYIQFKIESGEAKITNIIADNTAPPAYYTLSGYVTLNGTPVAGATVTISGTSTKATTNEEGHYSFSNISDGTSVTLEIAANETTAPLYNSYTSSAITVSEDTVQNIALSAINSISSSAFFSANDLAVNTYDNGTVYWDYFTQVSSKTMAVYEQTNGGTFVTYGGVDYNKRLNTGGADRDLSFYISGPAYIQVIMQSSQVVEEGQTPEVRNLQLFKGTRSGTQLVSTTAPVNTATAMYYNITEAGKYTIHPDKNINIFSIAIVMGTTRTDVSNGVTINDGTDTYIFAKVDSSNLTKDSLTLTIGEATDTTDKVYTEAKIGNIVINAQDLNTDYVYGVKVTGTAKNTVSTFSIA